jgi:hypothetical protein
LTASDCSWWLTTRKALQSEPFLRCGCSYSVELGGSSCDGDTHELVMLAIGLVGIVIGAFLYAAGLHLWMVNRYGHRDYRPDLQQTARILTIARWISVAFVIVGAWVLFMERKWDIAIYLFVGWFVISLLVQITAKTLRKWGTEA